MAQQMRYNVLDVLAKASEWSDSNEMASYNFALALSTALFRNVLLNIIFHKYRHYLSHTPISAQFQARIYVAS
jgi:hypothetical protein